jgi:hypothetical protein
MSCSIDDSRESANCIFLGWSARPVAHPRPWLPGTVLGCRLCEIIRQGKSVPVRRLLKVRFQAPASRGNQPVAARPVNGLGKIDGDAAQFGRVSSARGCGWSGGNNQRPIQPPSTVRISPLTQFEASEARNSTGPLKSSTSPQRPAGMRCRMALKRAGSSCRAWLLSVRT